MQSVKSRDILVLIMEKEKKFKKLEPIQYLASGGFVFLLIASLCSIFLQEDWSGTTLIPYYKINFYYLYEFDL